MENSVANEEKTIAVLGCGWLGLPLGRRLAARGLRVHGSTTSPEKRSLLRAAGIASFLLTLGPELRGSDASDFFRADQLFLNVPPPRGQHGPDDVASYHVRQAEAVLAALRPPPARVRHVVFASTTGVYPGGGRELTEEEAPPPGTPARAVLRPGARAVLEAEEWLQEAEGLGVTVLRFGGLYGYDRPPGRFLAGRTEVRGGAHPVNMIHRDDAVGLVEAALESKRAGVFNACAPAHPARRAFYTRKANALSVQPPTFCEDEGEEGGGKTVSSQKARRELGYTFQHPDPMKDAP